MTAFTRFSLAAMVMLFAFLALAVNATALPINIPKYKEITVPVICHAKEAFLEVVNAFAKEGRLAGLTANRLNMRMRLCYSRPTGYIFQPEKLVAEVAETQWTLKGVIFEGVSQRADRSWETMYAWVPTMQLDGVQLGDDV